MVLTLVLLLLISAFISLIYSAIKRSPEALWLATLLVVIALLLQVIPLK
jgi:hypothetical protein